MSIQEFFVSLFCFFLTAFGEIKGFLKIQTHWTNFILLVPMFIGILKELQQVRNRGFLFTEDIVES